MRASLGILLAVALSLGGRTCLAQANSTDTGGPCVDVQVGSERLTDLDCINRQLRLHVEREHAAPALPPIDAHSSSTAVGTANQAAAQQMMGSAFGKSGQPQRPPPPVFAVPLTPPPGAH
jgi:hypothetical protein